MKLYKFLYYQDSINQETLYRPNEIYIESELPKEEEYYLFKSNNNHKTKYYLLCPEYPDKRPMGIYMEFADINDFKFYRNEYRFFIIVKQIIKKYIRKICSFIIYFCNKKFYRELNRYFYNFKRKNPLIMISLAILSVLLTILSILLKGK